MKMQSKVWSAAVVVALVVLSSSSASAFCGFYVGGAGAEMFNNATEVVLMREGTTTVLSMQNNYQGPPKDFAMVVPVPVVLKEKEVKVIGDDVFAKVDKLGAPRLVEYWEQDPCPVYPDYADEDLEMAPSAPPSMMRRKRTSSREPKVKIEAQFDVGEYNVVILSAKESNALEAWLVDNEYNIPSGAAGVLKGYIEQGFYFFVAKVDAEKVTFDEKTGSAMLSPLRFHYDSESFFLPVRLGLLNAKGPQDLIVSILGPNQRYEVANAKNVAIPTNLHVDETVKESFAEFYVSLFDYTMKQNPGAVVTEYSWQAMKCDPCPDGSFRDTRGLGGALNATDLATLGADVLGKPEDMNFGNWVLTRLHTRYTADELEDDLVFKAVDPVEGGRGTPVGQEGKLDEEGVQPGSINSYQGRYVILHEWEGAIECENPQRGMWGGPLSGGAVPAVAATDTAMVMERKGVVLADALTREDAPAVAMLSQGSPRTTIPKLVRPKGSRCSAAPSDASAPVELLVLAGLIGAGVMGWSRRD